MWSLHILTSLFLLSFIIPTTLSSFPSHDPLMQAPLLRSPSADPKFLEELKIALSTLQTKFFDFDKGVWPRSIDWTSAVLGTILAGSTSTLTVHSPGDFALTNTYFAQVVAYYYGQRAESLKRQAYDDILWVVLNWLEALQTIWHRADNGTEWAPLFAKRAYDFYQIAWEGWDRTLCGGGMIWSPWLEPYKNAITNELYISASISMYLRYPYPPRNTTYLKNALAAHRWLRNSNMTDKTGLWVDGFHISRLEDGGNKCDIRNEMVYTYNQGVILSALRDLAEATGEKKYLGEGISLVESVIASENTVGELMLWGILTEKCDPGGYCSQNGHMFKGIWMHHLTAFCRPSGWERHRNACKRYLEFVKRNAAAAWNTRNKEGVAGTWWGVPAGWNSVSAQRRDTRPRGALDIENECSSTADVCEARQRPRAWVRGDLNDRGRGRTVETHAGLVAALRAVLEMSANDHRDPV